MKPIIGGMVAATVLALTMISDIRATDYETVSKPSEREEILKKFEESPMYTSAVEGKKVVACKIVKYTDQPEGTNAPSEYVEALQFNYDDGKTIRTVYSVAEDAVVKVEELEAYPTPLADEELERAKELAKEKISISFYICTMRLPPLTKFID